MKKITPDKLARALELARKDKCKVSHLDGNEYQVTNMRGVRRVVSFTFDGKNIFADCAPCQANLNPSVLCRHIGSAWLVAKARREMREAASTREVDRAA